MVWLIFVEKIKKKKANILPSIGYMQQQTQNNATKETNPNGVKRL